MPFKTTLEAAIAHLKSKGTIKKDGDVVTQLGLKSKGNVSSYASGAMKMSNSFRKKFENFYKLNLDDFANLVGNEEEIEVKEDIISYSKVDSYKDQHIALLTKYNALLEKSLEEEQDTKKALKKELEEIKKVQKVMIEDLNGLAHSQQVSAAIQISFQEYWLEHFVADKGNAQSLLKKIRQKAFDSLLKIKKEGIESGAGIGGNDRS